MRVRTLETPELGDRSYVVDDGEVAVVVDPQRDLDRLEPMLEHDVSLVLETHVHNDYVTGGLELARRTSAAYGLNAADEVGFDHEPLHDGQELRVGTLAVRVLATPGHTPTHLSYVVRDTADPAHPPAVFSGGSLLYGTVGRTDLVDPALAPDFAAEQYRSAQLLGSLPPAAALFPTHGFGSFCAGGGGSAAETSTIADELDKNRALTATSLESFVDELLASFTSYPAYYAHMAALNSSGPGPVHLTEPLRPVTPDELRALILEGAAVIDLRTAEEFAAAHLAGTTSINLGSQFATYVGWLTPWGGPLAVIGADHPQLEEARRQLARIGIDGFARAWGPIATLGATLPTRSYRRSTFADLAAEVGREDVVLDVRRDDEYAEDHVRGAVHLPLHEVERRVAELPMDARVWVYCAGGFRAGTAASLIEAHVREVVHVDDQFAHAVELGLTGP